MGAHWKIQYRGGDCLKRGGLDSLPISVGGGGGGGACQERGGWCPNAHYELSQDHLTHILIQPSVIASNWCVRG